MPPPTLINRPWDALAFGIDCYELANASADNLHIAAQTPGHHTVRVDPLASKQQLHQYGFYYCDTLLLPQCAAGKLNVSEHPDITIGTNIDRLQLQDICHGAFAHGRFHRDFNLDPANADTRYDNWLRQLHEQKSVYGLFWHNQLAGFIAYSGNNFLLHAIATNYRGKGLAKYWWSAVCVELFGAGHSHIVSSVSASNVAAINLYASLGFSFNKPLDIYHKLVK